MHQRKNSQTDWNLLIVSGIRRKTEKPLWQITWVSATLQVSFCVTSAEESNTKGISGQGNRKKTRTADDVTINVTFCKATSLNNMLMFIILVQIGWDLVVCSRLVCIHVVLFCFSDLSCTHLDMHPSLKTQHKKDVRHYHYFMKWFQDFEASASELQLAPPRSRNILPAATGSQQCKEWMQTGQTQ